MQKKQNWELNVVDSFGYTDTYVLNRLTRTGKNRLLKLANFLESIPPQQFNLSVIVEAEVLDKVPSKKTIKQKTCGTAGCAIGYCPVVFRGVKYKENDDVYDVTDIAVQFPVPDCSDGVDENFSGAEQFFGISGKQAEYLFMPDAYHPSKRGPKSVAARIKAFVNRDGYIKPNTKAFKQEYYV